MSFIFRNSFQNRQYYKKLLQTETANQVALFMPGASEFLDFSRNGFAASSTSVTFGAAGIGDGRTAATYNGTSSYTDIYSAGLANDNLLSNGGFETAGGCGADVWGSWTEGAGDGALANETTLVHQGSDAAKLTAGATANTFIRQNFSVTAGKRYRVRFYTRGDGTNDGRYRIYDLTNGEFIANYTNTGVTGTSYTLVSQEFTAPAGSSTCQIYIHCPSTDTGVAYFDAVEVRSLDGFLGDEGTLLAWAKVSGSGVWTDGSFREAVFFGVDGDNNLYLRKSNANNVFQWAYKAGGITESIIEGSHSETGFFSVVLTWSKSADEVKAYFDGSQAGSTQAIAGTWSGDLASSQAVIGALDTGPTRSWDGDIGPVAIWNKALSAEQIARLAVP